MNEDDDMRAMLAYALQEQRRVGNTYTAALLSKIPDLLAEIEALKARRRKRQPLIASDEFPDESKIVRLQVQGWLAEADDRKRGKTICDLKTYVWDRPEAYDNVEEQRNRDGYYEPLRFWLNTVERYKPLNTGSKFERTVAHLANRRHDNWLVRSLAKKGSKFGRFKGSRRWGDQGAIIAPDMSLVLVIRNREFEFKPGQDMRATPGRDPAASDYIWYWLDEQ